MAVEAITLVVLSDGRVIVDIQHSEREGNKLARDWHVCGPPCKHGGQQAGPVMSQPSKFLLTFLSIAKGRDFQPFRSGSSWLDERALIKAFSLFAKPVPILMAPLAVTAS